MYSFSAKYIPTSLFSLKESNSTNSGAKSVLLPSSFAVKMAILNQAITIGGDLEKLEVKNSKEFNFIKDVKISFHLSRGSSFCVNNSFVKILKPAREGGGLQQTVSFREYVYISHPIEIIFEIENKEAQKYLKLYLHKINYFGKRGCFFQFMEYSDNPTNANVLPFNLKNESYGILQEYDDFNKNATFDMVNNFSLTTNKRAKEIFVLPLNNIASSKSFSHYKFL